MKTKITIRSSTARLLFKAGRRTKFFVAQISKSAVSPISNRLGAGCSTLAGLAKGLRIGNPRSSRMQSCATTKEFCPANFKVCCALLIGFMVCGPASPARAQTGAYTLNGGTASLVGITNSTSTADQSGIYVYNSGALTVGVVKTTTSGSASSTDNSDKYGINAGILAGNSTTKGTVVITNGVIVTSGSVANGLFATYSGSSVTMLGGSINCSGANAHGVDATYGGSITLSNVTVISSNANSSAIATDFGGGYVTMIGGSALAADTASGSHSAAVYSTGIIRVKDATVTSVADCGGVIDGANSIILTNTVMTGTVEGIKLWKTAPASGAATVILNGGSLTASSGDGFYVTGTTGNAAWGNITVESNANVTASSGNILNVDSSSAALFTVSAATLAGNLIADSTSSMTNILQNGATLTGCVNAAKLLTIDATSTWNATSNSVVNNTLTNYGTVNLTGKLTCPNVIVTTNAVFGGSGTLSSNLTVNTGAKLILNPSTNFVVGGKLIFGNAVTIVPSTTNVAAGTYKLLAYSNTLSSTPTFSYTNGNQTAVFDTATSGVIYVTISVPVTTPVAPTSLTATAGDSQVALEWNAVTNATSYYVKRSFVSGSSYTNVSSSSTTNFTSASLANGTLYYFVVTATNTAGESGLSSEVSARPTSSLSTNLTLTAGSGTLTLSWPADHTGWKLQAQTNTLDTGLGTNWVDLGDYTQTNQANLPGDQHQRQCLLPAGQTVMPLNPRLVIRNQHKKQRKPHAAWLPR